MSKIVKWTQILRFLEITDTPIADISIVKKNIKSPMECNEMHCLEENCINVWLTKLKA